jgi:hypothetical protein
MTEWEIVDIADDERTEVLHIPEGKLYLTKHLTASGEARVAMVFVQGK